MIVEQGDKNMREEYSYNIILLGGTGAKCGELLIHMCANGYFQYNSLSMLYIDSDMNNGNAQKFKNLYNTYQNCRKEYRIEGSPLNCFFNPTVKLWYVNPVQNFKYFKDMLNVTTEEQNVTEAAKALMEILYSKEEMNLEISNGFFAHPNVGAAIFAANIDDILKTFLLHIRKEMQEMKKVKIFLLGSIFGGTGASSLPTLAHALKKSLFGESENKNIAQQLKIGGCMVLPYFLFSRKKVVLTDDKEDPNIEADKFALKTRSALEYYKYVDNEEGRKTFDELFILGHEKADIRGFYAPAGSSQRNLPHIVEFFAAMSSITFFEDAMEKTGKYFAVVPTEKISGSSIYKAERGYALFFIMMRFAIVMKSLILEELFDYTQGNKLRKDAKMIPWYYDFLNGKGKAKDFQEDKLYNKFSGISEYCSEYVRWFAELNLDDINKLNSLRDVYQNNEGVVKYLSFFSPELLFRQYQNIQIWDGNLDIDEDVAKNIYKENIKYIRRNLEHLENIHFYTDQASEKVGMDKIWSRLSDMGFSSFVKKDEVFKNIRISEDKSMESGVRNLINAIFCACLF